MSLLFTRKKQKKNCAALDGDTTFQNYILNEYDWNATCDLDAVLRPCGPFISTMESTNHVTSSLVLPMTYAILHATSSDFLVQRYVHVNGELTDEDLKVEKELNREVQDVRRMLCKENKRRFVGKETVGHKEDLLISKKLDPHFKLMDVPVGYTNGMKEDAENYLRSAYRLDRSSSTVAKAKRLADVAEGIDTR